MIWKLEQKVYIFNIKHFLNSPVLQDWVAFNFFAGTLSLELMLIHFFEFESPNTGDKKDESYLPFACSFEAARAFIAVEQVEYFVIGIFNCDAE